MSQLRLDPSTGRLHQYPNFLGWDSKRPETGGLADQMKAAFSGLQPLYTVENHGLGKAVPR
jgi:hypothetical protein